MGARGGLIAGGVALLLALAGAAFVPGVIHRPIMCEGPPPPAWGDDPYHGYGVQVADLKEAAPYLAFTPIVGRALGPAAKFFISGNTPDMSAKSLIWAYDQARFGRFWIQESITQVTQPEIDAMSSNPSGCSLDSVVTLRNGTRAALSERNPAAHGSGTGTGEASVMWLDHGLLITATGYSESFTKDRAIEVANQF